MHPKVQRTESEKYFRNSRLIDAFVRASLQRHHSRADLIIGYRGTALSRNTQISTEFTPDCNQADALQVFEIEFFTDAIAGKLIER